MPRPTSASAYRTQPLATEHLPPGIAFIVANEAAERFSYYGMRTILVVFMTQYLTNAQGQLAPLSEASAQGYYHLFLAMAYITPLLGALLADGLWGKYRTIIALSFVYCLGHFVLALDTTLTGLLLGQTLIALGAGGIKPCVSAHVGDQFCHHNQHLLSRVFSWFYFAINLGAVIAMLLMPWLLARHGAHTAFAVPGLLMLLATLIFWLGRRRYCHIRPQGRIFIRQIVSRQGLATLARLGRIYIFIALFWALFEQTGSSWVLQAAKMDRELFGLTLLPSQIQASNPLLILLLTPLFAYYIYPFWQRHLPLTPLTKMRTGLVLTALAFLVSALIQSRIDQGGHPSILWQLLAYLLLTSAEVMVSITCLEFSYTQAPKTMKAWIMAFFYLAIAAGNLFTSLVNFSLDALFADRQTLSAGYFWFFAGLMLITALLFNRFSRDFILESHLQDGHSPPPSL
ncbi:MAG: MFS transporter [Methylococcales bacterium]|nr:MFS transporter [Methylococcales bacterium]